ncbi:DNA polymerase kappa [Xylariales sp. PMI_506]|nr:DNA polymerase kappa [Xylariales sp. PMI_506]
MANVNPTPDAEVDKSESTADTATTSKSASTIPGHDTLKYHLLGPSLTKAGQDAVDQSKVSEVIYNASKGSKFFNHEEVRDASLTEKIARILTKKSRLEKIDLSHDLRQADVLITQLEAARDLTQYIVHVDCDAFYAAVEQLDHPELKDVPFAVGAGVLTTCNYAARKFGVRSGMASFVAKKLCPSLQLIRPNFDKYTAKAQEVREVLVEYDPRFESASCDEAYLNITEYCAEHSMTPADAVEQMRAEIHERTKITVSAGIAANAKLAKICSNMNKPNGQYVLANERQVIMSFMRDLSTRKVNGIGRVLERELAEIGIKTCGDIYPNRQYLRQLFGEKTFEFLIMVHLGLGRTSIQPAEEYERKSVGTESTFRDMSDPVQLREKLRWTADELEKDMRRAECKGRTLVLKVKLHTYEVFTRQVITPKAIYQADDLYNYALPILNKLEQDMPGMRLRLMGLRCTHLVSTKKPDTRAFFGFKSRRSESVEDSNIESQASTKRKADVDDEDQEWETWPEAALHHSDGELENPAVDAMAIPMPPHANDGYRHHGKEIVPNPQKATSPQKNAGEEWWDCPICSRPQTPDERLFNEHIDLCLSRQTIRDAVQGEAELVRESTPKTEPPDNKRIKLAKEKKRTSRSSAMTAAADPRQSKLFFGGL